MCVRGCIESATIEQNDVSDHITFGWRSIFPFERTTSHAVGVTKNLRGARLQIDVHIYSLKRAERAEGFEDVALDTTIIRQHRQAATSPTEMTYHQYQQKRPITADDKFYARNHHLGRTVKSTTEKSTHLHSLNLNNVQYA